MRGEAQTSEGNANAIYFDASLPFSLPLGIGIYTTSALTSPRGGRTRSGRVGLSAMYEG